MKPTFHSNGCRCATCADRCSLPWKWTVKRFCVTFHRQTKQMSLHRWTERWWSGLIHSQPLICLDLRVKDKFSLVSSANSHLKESSMTIWALYRICLHCSVCCGFKVCWDNKSVGECSRHCCVYAPVTVVFLFKAVFDWDWLVSVLHQTECSYLACGWTHPPSIRCGSAGQHSKQPRPLKPSLAFHIIQEPSE